MKTQQKGFTLIELMIVIAIIGILASVALPAYREYIVTSKVGTIFQTVKGLQNSIDKTYTLKGATVFTNTDYNCNDKNCYQQFYGQPDVPVVPGNLLSLRINATAVGTGTCSSAPWIGTTGAAVAAGAIVMTHPVAGAANLIDENLAGAVFTFHPTISAAGVTWTLNSSLSGALGVAGKEMETVTCKYLHETINKNG